MESRILQKLKAQNPDKEYPSNVGQKWTDEEEALLLGELSANTDISAIAQSHNRTIGGIRGRQKEIAYKMYKNNIPIEEIKNIIRLEREYIIETVRKRENKVNNVIELPKVQVSIESEISEIKKDIAELKSTLSELVEMMKAVYEFEDA